jgi:hypothetical protein
MNRPHVSPVITTGGGSTSCSFAPTYLRLRHITTELSPHIHSVMPHHHMTKHIRHVTTTWLHHLPLNKPLPSKQPLQCFSILDPDHTTKHIRRTASPFPPVYYPILLIPFILQPYSTPSFSSPTHPLNAGLKTHNGPKGSKYIIKRSTLCPLPPCSRFASLFPCSRFASLFPCSRFASLFPCSRFASLSPS